MEEPEFIEEGVDEESGELGPVIARRKRFMLLPMDELEAIEQMVLSGHENFFVFYNANTQAVNVLYKRRNGIWHHRNRNWIKKYFLCRKIELLSNR
jgi:hypothetical protein